LERDQAVPRGKRRSAVRFGELVVIAGLAILSARAPSRAQTASFTAKDLQVLGRAITFLQPAPTSDAVIAIAYAPSDPGSRRDADGIASLISAGAVAGRISPRARVVDVNAVETAGATIVIAAAGANGPRLSAASRAARALCVTTDVDAVRAGLCAMAINAEPRVEIILNHAVSAAAGIEFVAAFRMMIQEM
jgi:hypothetical protein